MTNLLKKFLNFFFPAECLSCEKEGYFVCPECLEKIPLSHESWETEGVRIHTLSSWKSPLVQDAIKQLKFRYASDVIKNLQPFTQKALKEIFFPPNAVFVPVPLHSLRQNKRGFNQSDLLADSFAVLPVEKNLLKRHKNTYPQSLLENEKRKENIRDAFSIKKNLSDKNTPIFLVDDVVMSASTVLECAKTLQKAGYNNVSAVVFAKSRKQL